MKDEFVNPAFFKNNKFIPNGGIFIFFLLWPFGTLLYSLYNYRSEWSKNIIWLYTIFFGFTFVIPTVETDAYVYARSLELMAQPGYSIRDLFSAYFSTGSGVLDIAQRLITFLVSRFTTDYRFLFAVFGIFMGYFISRVIWFLIDSRSNKIDFFSILILFAFSMVIGIWDIGGVRWNVAAVMFVFGLLKYLMHGNKRAIWIMAATIFVHWSFTMAFFVFLVYFVLGNRSLWYFGLFVISVVVADLNLDFVRELFNAYAPAPLLESRGSYLSEAYVEHLAEDAEAAAWYYFGGAMALKWYLFAFAGIFYLWGLKKIRESTEIVSLFNFTLLYYGIFNILSVIPSVMRFIEAGFYLLLAVLFYSIGHMKGALSGIIRFVGVPVLLLYAIVRLRFGADYIGGWAIFGSPIFIYFTDNDTPIIDFIKDLL
jgi:hypothetical protein